MKKNKTWTPEELIFLSENYPDKGKHWCALKMNRTEGSIRYKASELKLSLNKNSDFFKEFQERAANSKVGKKRPEHSKLMSKYAKEGRFEIFKDKTEEEKKVMSENKKKWHKQNEHPKGFKGKSHSVESINIISEKLKSAWDDPNSKLGSEEVRQKLSDSAVMRQKSGGLRSGYSRGRQGKYDINGVVVFFRSSWEANYALYLDFLIKNKQISKWEFEPDTFWFDKIKRGVRSYLPDFKVYKTNGDIEYHEVKGWMDDKSKTKLKRMRIYYPEVKIVLIDSKPYNEIKSKLGKVLKFF